MAQTRSIHPHDSGDLVEASLRSPSLLRGGTVQIETETGEAWSVMYSNGDLLIVARLSDLHQEWRLGEDWRSEEYRLPSYGELDQLSVAQRGDLDKVRAEDRDGERLVPVIGESDGEDQELALAHHHYVSYTPGRHNGLHHPPEHLCQRCGLSATDTIHQDVRGWSRRRGEQ